jgi:membrane fusion protein (multidrug efflux system)
LQKTISFNNRSEVKMTRKNILALLIISAFLFTFVSCNRQQAEDANKKVKINAEDLGLIPVKVAIATRENLENIISSTGTLLANKEVPISPEVSAIIKNILVDTGDTVKEGQTIALLDETEIKLNYEQAEALLAQAEAGFQNAKLEYERKKQLLKEEAIPQGMFDAIESQYRLAKAGVESARAQVNLTRERLENCTIRSPINGFVKAKLAAEGEYYQTMKGGPIFMLIQSNPIKLLFTIAEQYSKEIHPGLITKIRVATFPERVFAGKTSRVSPSTDPVSHTLNVEALFSNPTYELKPGFFAEVDLVLSTKSEALTVPSSALLVEEGTNYLYINDNGVAKKVEVQIGYTSADKVEITNGINEGDQVVTSGQETLVEGNKIRIIKS